jgi:hypothetical protein
MPTLAELLARLDAAKMEDPARERHYTAEAYTAVRDALVAHVTVLVPLDSLTDEAVDAAGNVVDRMLSMRHAGDVELEDEGDIEAAKQAAIEDREAGA